MTAAIATALVGAFLVSSVLFAAGLDQEPRKRIEGLTFSTAGGALFVILHSDRILFTSTEWRQALDFLPYDKTTDFTSPTWLVWFTGIYYLLRAIMRTRISNSYPKLANAVGTHGSYVTLVAIVVELLHGLYNFGQVLHWAIYLILLPFYLLPWPDLLQVFVEFLSRLPTLASIYFPRFIKDIAAYLTVPFGFIATFRRWTSNAAERVSDWMDRKIEAADTEKTSRAEGILQSLEDAIPDEN